MKMLTVRGQLFKDVAEMIVANHGFGSKKMVKRCPDLYDWSALDFNNPDVHEAYYFLIENGWIREYMPMHTGKDRRCNDRSTWKFGATFIGLTEKGWAVANKYIAVEHSLKDYYKEMAKNNKEVQ